MMKKTKLVFGIGINDYEFNVYINKKPLISYVNWISMLRRCYDQKYQLQYPTYIGCSVCEEWKYFSNFKKWHDDNYRMGFQLDKDILIKGNKVYSPSSCRYVPSYLNGILLDNSASRGVLPLGVSASMSKGQRNVTYLAQCHDGTKKQLNKTFKTIEEAVKWYAETKKLIVRQQVKRALDEGAIDQQIANALTSRDFSSSVDIMSFGDYPHMRSK